MVDGPCRAGHLRCPYHGRQFALDGSFVDEPLLLTRSQEVRREIAGLLELELIGDLRSRVEWLPLDDCVLDTTRSRDYLVEANWALYCDNYLEGFHIPFVHPALASQLDFGAYRTELFRYSSLQVGVAAGGEATFDPPPSSPENGLAIAGYYFWLFPNMMFNVYPWGVSVNVVKPLAVDRTKVSFLTYVFDESRLDRGAGAALDRVEREDEAIVESVQRGVQSRVYDRGRYSPDHERGVHHFHRLLAEFAGGTAPG